MINDITFSDFRELLKCNRTVRRFDSNRPITVEILHKLVELARFTASGRNAQPLKYRITRVRDK